jgi:hypothetical protein
MIQNRVRKKKSLVTPAQEADDPAITANNYPLLLKSSAKDLLRPIFEIAMCMEG